MSNMQAQAVIPAKILHVKWYQWQYPREHTCHWHYTKSFCVSPTKLFLLSGSCSASTTSFLCHSHFLRPSVVQIDLKQILSVVIFYRALLMTTQSSFFLYKFAFGISWLFFWYIPHNNQVYYITNSFSEVTSVNITSCQFHILQVLKLLSMDQVLKL